MRWPLVWRSRYDELAEALRRQVEVNNALRRVIGELRGSWLPRHAFGSLSAGELASLAAFTARRITQALLATPPGSVPKPPKA